MMKKKSSLVLLLSCVVLLPLLSFTIGTEYERGDVNKDGRVNIDDVTCLINYLLTDKWPADDNNLPYGTKTFYFNGVGFGMVRVDGGTFMMGATEEQGDDANENEYPAHEVTVSSFYISQIEVTRQLWLEIMGSTPGNDCQEFIAKLNERSHQSFRLPTEAEWEFAARGGNLSHGYKYAGSNNIDEVGWYGGAPAGYGSHNVAKKKENELLLFDMTGNVHEWCQDYYGPYSSEPQTDPTGPESGTFRVYRGGCYEHSAARARVSYRGYINEGSSYFTIGFRLVLPCDD